MRSSVQQQNTSNQVYIYQLSQLWLRKRFSPAHLLPNLAHHFVPPNAGRLYTADKDVAVVLLVLPYSSTSASATVALVLL